MITIYISCPPEFTTELAAETLVEDLGGNHAFVCVYEGDDNVAAVEWSYDGSTTLPAEYGAPDVCSI